MPLSRYGPWFWVFAVYSYFLVFAGSGLLLKEAIGYSSFYKKKSILIVAAALFPLIFSFVYPFRICPFDLTPVSFSLSSFFAFIGIYRLRLMEIIPIARDKVIENMADAVMVFDEGLRLIDLNRCAEKFLSKRREG